MIAFTPTSLARRKLRSRRPRGGMILAVVLVALLIVMLLGAALANRFVARRQFVRRSQQQQQAFWLAESAMHRAVYRVANDPDYKGETWEVPAAELGGTHAGVALVRIETVADAESTRRIVVDASYPSESINKIVQHRERIVSRSTE